MLYQRIIHLYQVYVSVPFILSHKMVDIGLMHFLLCSSKQLYVNKFIQFIFMSFIKKKKITCKNMQFFCHIAEIRVICLKILFSAVKCLLTFYVIFFPQEFRLWSLSSKLIFFNQVPEYLYKMTLYYIVLFLSRDMRKITAA